jgi:hypothetical protein
VMAIVSISTGMWCSINRLWDFRLTAEIARTTEQLGKNELTSEKSRVQRLGNRTWVLLYFQFSTFLISVLLLIGALALTYHSKLF